MSISKEQVLYIIQYKGVYHVDGDGIDTIFEKELPDKITLSKDEVIKIATLIEDVVGTGCTECGIDRDIRKQEYVNDIHRDISKVCDDCIKRDTSKCNQFECSIYTYVHVDQC